MSYAHMHEKANAAAAGTSFPFTDDPTENSGAAVASVMVPPIQTSSSTVETRLLSKSQSATEVNINVLDIARKRCERFDPLFEAIEHLKLARVAWTRDIDPPSDIAIDDARGLLGRLEARDFPPDRILASAEGGIGMYFRLGEKYADFECSNTGAITAVISDGHGAVSAFEVHPSFEGENSAISKIRAFLRD